MTASGTSGGAAHLDGHRYRLDSRVATGGMGEVWRATDTVLDRVVAVKVLRSEYADDPTFRSRFEAEARNAAALHHPGVASVFDFGEVSSADGSPRPFLVMELVPGEPLSALLRDHEPMLPDRAADLVAQAADAIAAAHALDIVHRDVKPGNLLVTPDGTVKITDFGIARAADTVALTGTGEVIGTPHYISPEQAAGERAGKASDVYALGVVLYECLAGRRPFVADTPLLTVLAHLRDPVPPLPDSVPPHLRDVTMRALAKEPGDRLPGAADMAAALRGGSAGSAAGAGAGVAAAGATQVMTPGTRVLARDDREGTASSARRRLPAWWPLAAAALVVLLLIAAISSLFDGEGDPDNTPSNTLADNPSPSVRVPQKEPTPADDRIQVRASSYLGQDAKVAEEELEALGFRVRSEDRPATAADQQKDTVASVTPHGLVDPGATITLGVYDEFRPPEGSDQPKDEEGEGGGDDGGNGEDDGKGKPGGDKGEGNGRDKGKDED